MVSKPPLVSMPMTSCNVCVNGITFSTANFHPKSYYGRKNMFSCSSLPRSVSTSKKMTTGDQASGLNALRPGKLTEDGLSYKEKFFIRFSEVGNDGTTTIQTIANLLQEVGGNHAKGDGFSTDRYATTITMRKLHLIWVMARIHIEVHKYPAWSDEIEIESWAQSDGKIGVRRDWIIKDYANGEVIGRATSKWVMMNEDSRRLQRVSDDVLKEYLVSSPRTLKLAFPEENKRGVRKIAKLEDPSEYSRLGLMPRRSDLDLNNHVNNVTYIGWALESVPQEIIDTHELQAITLDYKRECKQGDIVDSHTSRESLDDLTNSNRFSAPKSDGEHLTRLVHLLQSADNGLEISRCGTVWRMKPAKG